MGSAQPSTTIRFLVKLLTVAYGLAVTFGCIALLAIMAIEMMGTPGRLRNLSIGIPGVVDLNDMRVASAWNGAITLDKTEVTLDVPLATAPTTFRTFSYAGLFGLYLLVLTFLRELRDLLRRVRDGVPFDERNARSVRLLGLLLIAGELGTSVFLFWQSRMVLRAATDATVPMEFPFNPNESIVIIGLVLIALAEVFRRGTVLEDEQAHVV